MNRRRFLQMTVAALGTAGAGGCGHRHSDTLDPVLSKDVAFAFDAEGHRYEMDFIRNQVRRVDNTGATVWEQGSSADPVLFNSPTSMAVDAQGTVFVADRANGEIERLNAQGIALSTFGEALLTAQDLVLDSATSTLYVIVSDTMSARLAWFDSRGAFQEHTQLRFEDGQIGHPLYLAIGPGGRLYATVI